MERGEADRQTWPGRLQQPSPWKPLALKREAQRMGWLAHHELMHACMHELTTRVRMSEVIILGTDTSIGVHPPCPSSPLLASPQV